MKKRPALAIARLLAFASIAAIAAPAAASRINTGPADAPFQVNFCPVLAKQLRLAQFEFSCTPSTGTRENVERVLADPRQLGYAQLDAFVLASKELAAEQALSIVRQDDVRQCLYAVTRNPELTNWGEVAANAARLRFVLPAAGSGSAASFSFLRSLDPDGLGRAKEVRHTPSIETAIAEALSAEDTVSLLVQFPDPDSAPFHSITEQGGHVVPVIDRTILRQEVGGRKIYFAQETQVEGAEWTRSGRRMATACTPVLIFTGSAGKVAPEPARKDHEDLIRTIAHLNSGALMPEEGLFGRLLKRSKELSAASTEKMLEATEQARAKVRPYTDKAMETAKETAEQAKGAAERASEAAKPYLDKSKEAARKAYDDAMRIAKELMQKKPASPPKDD